MCPDCVHACVGDECSPTHHTRPAHARRVKNCARRAFVHAHPHTTGAATRAALDAPCRLRTSVSRPPPDGNAPCPPACRRHPRQPRPRRRCLRVPPAPKHPACATRACPAARGNTGWWWGPARCHSWRRCVYGCGVGEGAGVVGGRGVDGPPAACQRVKHIHTLPRCPLPFGFRCARLLHSLASLPPAIPTPHTPLTASPHSPSLPPQDLAGWVGLPRSSTIVVVSDETVWRWHGAPFLAACAAVDVRPTPIVTLVPPGEGSKSRATKERIEDWMLQQRCV